MGVEGRAEVVQERLRHTPPWLVDAVLATLFVLVGILTTGHTTGADSTVVYEPRDAWAWALILAATLPYYLRSRWPLPVFLVSSVAVATLYLGDYDAGSLPTMLLVGAYTVAVRRPWRDVVVGAAVLGVLVVAMYLADVPDFGGEELVGTALGFAAVGFVGRTVQHRHQRIEALQQAQDEAKLRAAADERLRIARELHDVVAHSLGVIAMQAGVGMHVIDTDPDEARRALEHISDTSRSSLAEIRQLLATVRHEDGGSSYSPAPGLADLSRLVQEVEAGGLDVDLAVDVGLADLPPGVELAAYRIVQEALTNTLRHAHAARADVQLEARAGSLRIQVTDDGRGGNGSRAPGGHGLVGMRERAAVYRGSVEAGPRPGGGFRVTAILPYSGEAPR